MSASTSLRSRFSPLRALAATFRRPAASLALFGAIAASSGLSACARDEQPTAASEHLGSAEQAVWTNGDFEADNIGATPPTGWTVGTYLNGTGVTGSTASPPSSFGALNLSSTAGQGVQETFVVGGTQSSQSDPDLGTGQAFRFPLYGQRGVRVNYLSSTDNGKNKNANSLSQTMTVAAADVDPIDGTVHVRFAIAPVLENPAHGYTQQPYYYVEVNNVTKGTKLYGDFNIAGQVGVPWITTTSVLTGNQTQWTNWQLVDVAPGNAALAIGDQVKLTVVGSGCSLGGHFGRVYVDGMGSSIPGTYTWASGPTSASAGANIVYTVNYRNGGTASAIGAQLAMVTPPNTTYQSLAGISGCTTPAANGTGTVSCPLGTLAAGASGSFTVTVKINAAATGTIVNGNYSISAVNQPTLLGAKVTTTIISAATLADVVVTKTSSVATTNWGQTFTYTIVAQNNGPNALAEGTVTLADVMPAQLASMTWTCTATRATNDTTTSCRRGFGSGTGSINRNTLRIGVGGKLTFVVSARVNTGSGLGSITNTATATVGGGFFDSNTANNTATVTTPIGTARTLTVTKSGTGTGTVVSAPAGVSCGATCAGTFVDGETVVLTASPLASGTFTGWGGACASAGSAGTCTLTLSGNQTVTAAFAAAVVSTPANVYVYSGSNQFAATGAAFGSSLVALVTDQNGNPVNNATVTWSKPASGASATIGATSTTNASGLATVTATANATAGTYAVTPSVTGATTQSTFKLTNVGPAAIVTYLSGGTAADPNQTTIGTQFPAPLAVTVTDTAGNPVSGVSVAFAVPGSGASGTRSSSTATTGSNGQASITVTANNTASPVAAGPVYTPWTATATVASVGSVNFQLVNLSPGPASIFVISGTPQTTPLNNAFPTALTVGVIDGVGNPQPNQTITFTAPASGASATFTPAGGTATTDSSGIATIVVTANGTAGAYTVNAAVGGVATPAAFALTNDASQSVTEQAGTPQATVVNTNFGTQLQVLVADANDNPISGVVVTFAVPASTGASVTFPGGVATATTNSSGLASILVKANTHAGAYTVSASTALSGANTGDFALTNEAGAASKVVAISGGSQHAVVGAAFASPLVAEVEDAFGNAVSGTNVTFSAPTTGASASFPGGASGFSDGAGLVSVNATAGSVAGGYNVTATFTGATASASFALTNDLGTGMCFTDADCTGGDWCLESSQLCKAQLANGVAIPSDPPHANPTLNATCTTAAATLVCQTNACDADAKCGWLNGTGTCTTGADARCRSGACSANGTCMPVGGCNADGDCTSEQYCNTGAHLCAAKIANSGALVAVTGHTPDLSSAVCGSASSSTIGGIECVTAVCDLDNACGWKNGTTGCAVGAADARCRSGQCSANGACMPASGCNVDADCGGGLWCNESANACTAKLANGVAIPNDPPHTSPTLTAVCTSAAATLVCQVSVCDTDDKCGWRDGTSGCTASQADARCRSGECSADGTCKPLGGCNADADCAATQYCNTGAHACAAKIANSGALVAVAGHSPDLSSAVCASTSSSIIAVIECVTAVCDLDNACGWKNLTGACTASAADARCRTGVCDSDALCGWKVGTSGCTASTADTRCRSGQCSTNGACMPAGGCNVDADCGGGLWCNETTNTCTAKLANASPMPTDVPHANPTLDGKCTAPAALLVCQTSVCDADAKCGWADGTSGCTTGEDARCRSTACSANQTCMPLGGCNADADCTAAQYCDNAAHACAAKIANGSPLVTVSGHTPDLSVADCVTNTAIGGIECTTAVCDADNACGWKNSTPGCTASTLDARCRSAVCDADAKCGWADGTSGCTAATQDARCRSGACGGDGKCMPAGGCDIDSDCTGGKWCQETTHVCTAKLSNGTAMPTDAPHTNPALDGKCAAPAATLVCATSVCDTDDACGWKNGTSGCTTGADGRCRTGVCSVNGTCMPVAGCNADGDCASTQYCDTGAHACTAKIVNGNAVVSVTGHTPDLSIANCTTNGSIAGVECITAACDADNLCGLLNGTAGCAAQSADARCRTGVCDSDAACGWANGTAGCTESASDLRCRSGECGGDGKCMPAGGCNVDSDCAGGTWCNESQQKCLPRLANGAQMPTDPPHANPTLDGKCAAGAASLVCTTLVCDLDDLCGWADGTPGCTTGADVKCRSGACSTNGTCKPLAGCNADADCDPAQYCNTGAHLCAAKLPNGSPVVSVVGHTPALLVADCTANAAIGPIECATAVCDADSLCGLKNGTAGCSSGDDVRCRSGVCDTDAACGWANGTIGCEPSKSDARCRSGVCGGDARCMASGGCNIDSDCASGTWCNESVHTCTGKIANGGAMPTDAPHASPTLDGKCSVAASALVCASGTCDLLDDKCGIALGDGTCDGTGQCRAGVCVTSGQKPHTCEPCGANSDCGGSQGVCDVTAYRCVTCTVADHAACTGTTAFCNAATQACVGCNGNLNSGASFACGSGAPYCAADGSCSASCQHDADCASGSWCNAGTCAEKLKNGSQMPTSAGHVPTLDGACTSPAAVAVCVSAVCDATNNTCGIGIGDPGCTSDAQCQAGRCVPEGGGPKAGFCEPCLTNQDCVGPLLVCDPATNQCVACTAANATACVATTPVCDTTVESCVACNGDFGGGATHACPSSTAPLCTGSGACTVCESNADCFGHAGPICNTLSGSCGAACTIDSDCPAQWCDNPSASNAAGVCTPKVGNSKPLPADAPINGLCSTPNGLRVCAATVCETSDNLCGSQNGTACAVKDACRSGVCNADGKCGDPNGIACTAKDTCRSAVCNADGKCGDPNGTDCAKKDTCRSDVCFTDGKCGNPDGEVCTSADQCRTGECVGGHCGQPDAGTDAGDDADADDADAADDATDATLDASDATAERDDGGDFDATDAAEDQGLGNSALGGGCACETARKRHDDAGSLAALLAAVGLVVARRRRRDGVTPS